MTQPSGGPSAIDPPAGPFVDLQVHTTASDGALPPTRVVETARDVGLHAIAITDHDTIDGLPEAMAAGELHGVRIVPGVELSTHFGDDELHLLGLHLSRRETMASALSDLRDSRVERARLMVATLNRHGVPVTMDAVLSQANEGSVGRPHIARAMVNGGWVRDFREAFDRWLAWGKPAYQARERFDVADAIALVHRAGGLAIWAHPGDSATPDRIRRLAASGLDGVEVLHPSHPPMFAQKLFDVVESIGLLPSGGSDWHGTLDGTRRLGSMYVPKAWLDRQDAKCAASRL